MLRRLERERQDDADARTARVAPAARGPRRAARGPAHRLRAAARDARPALPALGLHVALQGAWRDLPFWRVVRLARARARARGARGLPRDRASPAQRYGALSGGQRQRVLLARAIATAARPAAPRRAHRRRRSRGRAAPSSTSWPAPRASGASRSGWSPITSHAMKGRADRTIERVGRKAARRRTPHERVLLPGLPVPQRDPRRPRRGAALLDPRDLPRAAPAGADRRRAAAGGLGRNRRGLLADGPRPRQATGRTRSRSPARCSRPSARSPCWSRASAGAGAPPSGASARSSRSARPPPSCSSR